MAGFGFSRLSAPLRLLLLPKASARTNRISYRGLWQAFQTTSACMSASSAVCSDCTLTFRVPLLPASRCNAPVAFQFRLDSEALPFLPQTLLVQVLRNGSLPAATPSNRSFLRVLKSLEVRNRRIRLRPCFRLRQVPHLTECV